MLSVRGIYDGKNIKLLENINIPGPKDVIITFIEDDMQDINAKDIYVLAEKSGAFDFLKEHEEDIYTDNDLKEKYKK